MTPDLPDAPAAFESAGSSIRAVFTRGSVGSPAGHSRDFVLDTTSYSGSTISDADFDSNLDGSLVSGDPHFNIVHMFFVLVTVSVGAWTPGSQVSPSRSSSSGVLLQSMSVRERVRLMRLHREGSQ